MFNKKSNKTFREIKSDLENPRTKTYSAFLEYILFEFNKINLSFQHSETRVHLLHLKSLLFLQLIARFFLKAALKAEWRLVHRDFYSRPEFDMRSYDEMWKTVFFSKYANGNIKYPQLTKLVGYIRSLPHSNAAAGRTFSLLPDIPANA